MKILCVFDIINKILETILDAMVDLLIDKDDDEELQHCLKLLKFIKALYDNFNYLIGEIKIKKETLNKETEKLKEKAKLIF